MNHFDTTLIPTISEAVFLVAALSYLFWTRKNSGEPSLFEPFAEYRTKKTQNSQHDKFLSHNSGPDADQTINFLSPRDNKREN